MLTRDKQAIPRVGGRVLGVVLINGDLKHDQNYYYYTNYYGYYQPGEGKGRSRTTPNVTAGGSVNGYSDTDEYRCAKASLSPFSCSDWPPAFLLKLRCEWAIRLI